jgi:peptide/nickel transport system substrate-binding protein
MVAERLARFARPTALAVAALLVAACTSAQPESAARQARPADSGAASAEGQPRRGGTITVALATEAVSFHPYKTTDSASRAYLSLISTSGLLTADPHQPREYLPELAESWTLADDRVTYTFHLRPNIRWSDGHPITSADFKWTFEQARNPENGYPYLTTLEPVVSYETPDPLTIVVTLKEPLAVGLESADAVHPLPKHIWERLDWSDPNKNPEIMAPTVASGPFKLKEWHRDSHATFVANDLYFKGRPNLDGVTFQIVGTSQISFEKLRTGDVDRGEIPPEHYEQAKRLENVTIYEWSPPSGGWNYLGFNLRKPHLQDVRVRRALAHAIDRQAIIERIQYGLAVPTYSSFPPACWCYNPDVARYDYNPERARELLAEAGWLPGADGVVTKDGQRLRLRLLFGPNSNKMRERIATVAQEEYRKIGVETEIQALEWAAFLQAIKNPPFDWDMTVLGWTGTIDPHGSAIVWSEKAIPQLNAGAYVNKRVEDLFEQGSREFDPDRRKAIYYEIQRIISDDAPYVFLTMNKAYTGVSKRVGGIEPTPLGINHNIEQWYIK